MQISQVATENLDRFTFELREKYEKETGKKIGSIESFDMSDFISFYGGTIEYINLDDNVKSFVIQLENSNSFTIGISNTLNPLVIQKKWESDFQDTFSNENLNPKVLEILKTTYEKGAPLTELNIELTRAFGYYIYAKQNKTLSYGDVLITPSLSPVSEKEITKTKSQIKKLILEKK